jgi:hypothetical protein
MHKYPANATSFTRERFFGELGIALARNDATRPLAEPLKLQNADLRAKRLAREAAEEALFGPRVEARFAEFEFDTEVRAFWHTVQSLDGSKGPLVRALFPDGVNVVVTCSGAAQMAVGQKFLKDFKASRAPGIEKVQQEWVPRIEGALAKLMSAIGAREDAQGALATARSAEEAAKLDHELALEKLMGEIRKLYPKDRQRQDLLFPTTPSASSRAETSRDEEKADEPAAEPK